MISGPVFGVHYTIEQILKIDPSTPPKGSAKDVKEGKGIVKRRKNILVEKINSDGKVDAQDKWPIAETGKKVVFVGNKRNLYAKFI